MQYFYTVIHIRKDIHDIYVLSMYDILKLKVDVHEALTVGAGWRERQPWETEGRVASPTPFHIFSLFFFFLC